MSRSGEVVAFEARKASGLSRVSSKPRTGSESKAQIVFGNSKGEIYDAVGGSNWVAKREAITWPIEGETASKAREPTTSSAIRAALGHQLLSVDCYASRRERRPLTPNRVVSSISF